jgi:hypothetical protein
MSELNKEEQISSLKSEIEILKDDTDILQDKMRIILHILRNDIFCYHVNTFTDIFHNKEHRLYIDRDYDF